MAINQTQYEELITDPDLIAFSKTIDTVVISQHLETKTNEEIIAIVKLMGYFVFMPDTQLAALIEIVRNSNQ